MLPSWLVCAAQRMSPGARMAAMGAYSYAFRHSLDDPNEFWGEAADAVLWARTPTVVCDNVAAPFVRWFPDGELNTCYNALDRHVEAGRAEQVALIHDSPVTGVGAKLTYRQLRDEVALFAGVLASLGVTRGERVIIYMPMVP